MELSKPVAENSLENLVQLTQRLWQASGDGLELEEVAEIVRALNELTLVGKIVADRVLNKHAVRNTIIRSWNPKFGVTISDLDDNIFLFKFKSEIDLRRIWNGEPWTIMGNHLNLKKWHADANVNDIDFSHSCFWIRIYGVPLTMQNNANGERIGKLLGHLLELDMREEGALYFR